MDWTPTIADRQGPLYQRIVNALADDIAAGRVRNGQALPTHRALARALGVDLTTVSRAYAEARRLGLTDAQVGRGTFAVAVSGAPKPMAQPGIDLSMNLPPQPPDAALDSRLAKTLADIRSGSGLSPYLTYQQPGGTLRERQIAADWIGPIWPGLAAERVLIAPGTQPVLFALLLAHAGASRTILAEQLTYPGLKAAAAATGIAVSGVACDEEGMVPAALDRAARTTAARLVYLMPTIHNPTTRTMPEERRRRIAEVIRKRDLVLVEDDPYSFFAPGALPVSAHIPERAYFAASLAKCLAPGLRLAIVVTPDATAAEALGKGLRANVQMPVPLMAAIATRWMRDGSASAIVAAIRAEAVARQALACAALAGQRFAANPAGLHVWLTLPDGVQAEAFAADLHGRGLAVVTASAFATEATPPSALRLALGAAQSRTQLARALDILASALKTSAAPPGEGRAAGKP